MVNPTALGFSTLQLVSLLVALLSWLILALLSQPRCPLNQEMHDIEMAFQAVGLLPHSNPPPKGNKDGGALSPMNINTEKENAQGSMEICGGLATTGLPFPGEILADGMFAIKYHNMYIFFFFIFQFKVQGYLLEFPAMTRRSGSSSSSIFAPASSSLAQATWAPFG